MRKYLLILCAALLLPACAANLQNQIDEQGKAITLLQKKNRDLDRSMQRLRDDYQSDIKNLRDQVMNMRSQGVQQPQADTSQQPGEAVEGSSDVTPAQPQPSRPAPPAAATDKDLYNQAYGLYNKGDYEQARKAFGDFIKTHPGSQYVSSAQYWIASSYFKEKQFDRAIEACDDVIKKYPQGTKTPDAYYLQALAFVEIKDPTTAQIILEDLIQKFPATEAANLGKQKYEELKK